jgi:hypothetical protein
MYDKPDFHAAANNVNETGPTAAPVDMPAGTCLGSPRTFVGSTWITNEGSMPPANKERPDVRHQ